MTNWIVEIQIEDVETKEEALQALKDEWNLGPEAVWDIYKEE